MLMDGAVQSSKPGYEHEQRHHLLMYSLNFKAVTDPDFGGFNFYVESGRLFDADDYADAYGLNRSDIDAQDIHSAQDAAGRLNEGEWLEVTHEENQE